MSTEEKDTQTGQKSPAKTKKVKKKRSSRFVKWFREMKSELKKVVWPTPQQILSNTIVSLVVMIVCAVVVWGFDTLAGQGIEAIISLGG